MRIFKHECHLTIVGRLLGQLLVNARREDQKKDRTHVAPRTGNLHVNYIFPNVHFSYDDCVVRSVR